MDSPIEALAFDHLSLGILAAAVNNLWTWLALLTAALSFWRIRSSSAVISISLRSQPLSDSPHESVSSRIDSPEASVSPAAEETISPMSPISSPAPVKSQSIFEDGDGATKGKFVVYFEDERVDSGEIESDSESEVAAVAGEWEYGGVLRMRMGDLGWYRHLDLKAINGNVVRLWDGVRV